MAEAEAAAAPLEALAALAGAAAPAAAPQPGQKRAPSAMGVPHAAQKPMVRGQARRRRDGREGRQGSRGRNTRNTKRYEDRDQRGRGEKREQGSCLLTGRFKVREEQGGKSGREMSRVERMERSCR